MFDKIVNIRNWVYSTKEGLVQEIPEKEYTKANIMSRFSFINCRNSQVNPSLVKPSFLKNHWESQPILKDDKAREFATIILSNGQVEVLTLSSFSVLVNELFNSHEELYQSVHCIQAFRDHSLPLRRSLVNGVSRNIIEFHNGKYFSTLKTGYFI